MQKVASSQHVSVTSGYRSKSANGRRGGASCSQHQKCRAIDFNVKDACAVKRAAMALGFRANAYSTTHIHVDNGPGSKQWTENPCGGDGGARPRKRRK